MSRRQFYFLFTAGPLAGFAAGAYLAGMWLVAASALIVAAWSLVIGLVVAPPIISKRSVAGVVDFLTAPEKRPVRRAAMDSLAEAAQWLAENKPDHLAAVVDAFTDRMLARFDSSAGGIKGGLVRGAISEEAFAEKGLDQIFGAFEDMKTRDGKPTFASKLANYGRQAMQFQTRKKRGAVGPDEKGWLKP